MTNLSVIALYMPFIVGTILILVSVAGKDMGNPMLREYLFFSVSLLGWQITESLVFVFSDPALIVKADNIKLVFVGLCAVFIVRMVVYFYKLDKKTPEWAFYIIFAIPAITLICAVSPLGDSALRIGYEVTSNYPLNEAVYEHGVWYQLNVLFSNFMVLTTGIIVMIMHYRLPKAYRNPSIAFMFALFFYAGGYAMEAIANLPLDVIMLGTGLSNLAVYFVVAKSNRGEYLSIARREIFNYLDEAIFILDEKKRIVDANKTALEWLRILGRELSFTSFEVMLDTFEEEGLIEMGPMNDGNSTEIRMIHTDIQLVFEMNEIDMFDDSGDVKGMFVTIEDVTRNSLFIDRLEIDAGMDPLTGLQNRYTYEELIIGLDVEDNLPISVIVGDVNSLKQINDTYGHMAGDSLLSATGEVIRKCCPERGFAARIGGDEFVMIIVKCGSDEAERIIASIKAELSKIDNLPFKVKMALGYVTKHSGDPVLRYMVNVADKLMYDDKTKEKGGSNDK